MIVNVVGFWYLTSKYKENQDVIHGIDSSVYSFSENTKSQIKANKESIARIEHALERLGRKN